MAEITHLSPLKGRTTTACCDRTPLELPRDDRMTNDVTLVTCGDSWATGLKEFTFYLHGGDDDIEFQLGQAFGREGFKVHPGVMRKITDDMNPFYEVGVRCEVNCDTGDIRLIGLTT